MLHVWEICEPKMPWDQREYYNGWIEDNVLQFPYTHCRLCEASLGRGGVIPISCPPELVRELRPTKGAPWISQDEFERRATRWTAIMRTYGYDGTIQSGDTFAPLEWNIPCLRPADIYWPTASDPIVSPALAKRLSEIGHDAVSFADVVARYTTESVPYEVAKPPTAKVREWFQTRVHRVPKPQALHRLGLVAATSPIEADGVKYEICSECGYRTQLTSDIYSTTQDAWVSNRVLPKRYVPNKAIFWSHIYYGGFVISDDAYSHLRPFFYKEL